VVHSTVVTTRKLTTTDGFVVLDLDGDAPAAGVVRAAPKVLVDGATWLARSQTYQFASFGRRVRGASAAVNAAPDLRDDAVEAFVDELAADLDAGILLLEPAKGLTAAHAAVLRAHDPRPASWWDHRDELRAEGVAAAVATVAAAEGCRVAIEGFDASGPSLVRALAERGATVVSVSTSSGTKHLPDGLAADVAAEAWTAHGPGFVTQLGGDAASPTAVFGVEADVLVVGSKVGVIDHDVAAGLQVGAVVPGGSLPVTAKALAALRRAEVTVLPDFVTTAGALFAWSEDGGEVAPETARAAAADGITEVLAEAADHPSGPVLGACERAEAFLSSWVDELPFGRPIG
jgi:glutamate dehydrogenase/leucine dehydrogenase